MRRPHAEAQLLVGFRLFASAQEIVKSGSLRWWLGGKGMVASGLGWWYLFIGAGVY